MKNLKKINILSPNYAFSGLLLFVFLITLLAVCYYSPVYVMAQKAMKIFVNEKPSDIKIINEKGVKLITLHFPVAKGRNTWTLETDYNENTQTIKIKTIHQPPKAKETMRGKIECNVCDASGDCQKCSGTGKITSGAECSVCNGSGDCWFCNGAGSY